MRPIRVGVAAMALLVLLAGPGRRDPLRRVAITKVDSLIR